MNTPNPKVVPVPAQDPKPVLYRNGSVYSAADPFATAMLVTGDTVAWVGSEHAAAALADSSMDVIDLQGALIAPGFVDSHVHTTETGLALTSLDLTAVNSLAELLELVAGAAADTTGTILGNGWDESRWSERRPPTAAELENASGGRDVYLVRADVHSAVVSASLAGRLSLQDHDGWDDGFVVRDAHFAVRSAVRNLSIGERDKLQRAALDHAAAHGIVAVVEMAAPHIAPREDVLALLERDGAYPEVLAYWGQRATSEEELLGILQGFDGRILGLGGDLNVDGSIGSHTARMRVPYADAPHSCGSTFMHEDDVAAHLSAATSAGLQAGFHVIGDEGLDTVIAGLEKTAVIHGVEKVRASRHRLEHVEMADDNAIQKLAHFGTIVSAQPGFDALWGAPGGLYEQRLGPDRYTPMNRVGSLLSQGVPVCLGSDSPVTRMSPWQSVRACIAHASPEERISARAAFLAHTRAGWRAVGAENPLLGQLVPGAPASYAVWEVDELMVQTPDSRVQSWSTDPRAGTPLLPALDSANEPRCLQTMHKGVQLFADDSLTHR
ncbi:amidohydrolase [Arthrobacter sp.]|uniref:amidohydrolase n=1 Tax=Arthrobacter sp. TaxID=1667 RepID=UPI002812777D|nr:amidohydrolase [Arthrobacter sp.]